MESNVTVYKPRWILDSDFNVIDNAVLVEENGKVTYIGNEAGAKAFLPGDPVIKEYMNGFLLPGLINSHTHICEVLLRGLCDDQSLDVWLWDYIWKVEPEMTPAEAYTGAKLGIAEMIAGGVVGFNDQYFFAGEIAKAVDETGIKAYLGPSIFDNNPETGTIEAAFKRAKDVHSKWHGRDNRLFIGFGPHAPYTVSEEWFKEINEVARERGVLIHTHLSETREEIQRAKESWNMSPIALMEEYGALERIVAAHCIHVDDRDRELLAKHGTPVLSCPQSNLKVAAGICNVPELLKLNIPVCLGTDGQASNNNLNVIEEMTLTALLHKGLRYDPTLIDAVTAIKTVTIYPSAIFPEGVYTGKLAVGNPADLMIVDFTGINMVPVINPVSSFVYSSNPSNVVLTACNGKVLYEQGKFTTLDLDSLKIEAQKAADRMIDSSGINDRS
ncbi:MAG: amidohydrolase family protein [Candidatus Hodarchaeales archaeon]